MYYRFVVILVVMLLFICGCKDERSKPFAISRTEVSNGLTIIIPDESTDQTKFAAKELQHFINEIFDCEIPIMRESEAAHCKRIVLRAVQTGPESSLGKEGYSIETEPGQLIISGGLPRGIIYGVYSFLEDYLGCRWFTPDCQRIPKHDIVVLPDIDKSYIPPLIYRDTSHVIGRDLDWAVRNKINGHRVTPFNAERGSDEQYAVCYHGLRTYVPPEKYFNEHPEYYALWNGKRVKDGQICLTNPEAREIAAEAVIAKIRDYKILQVSQNEGGKYCQCPDCKAIIKREGSKSGPLIDFANYIAERVAKVYPDKYILTLAYQWSTDPPEYIRAHPNVIIQISSIRCAFNHSLSSPVNAEFQQQIAGWQDKCDTIFAWDYTINFWHSLAPFPNLYTIAPNVRFFVEHNVKGIYEEGNAYIKGGEFLELRSYLVAKALWDPNIDTDKTIDDFLAEYYGPAAPFIKDYIVRIHELASDPSFRMGCFSGCTCPACKDNHKLPPYWAPEVIEEFIELFDQAEDMVADSSILLSRVRRARIPLMYKRICGEYLNHSPGEDHDPNMTIEKLEELVDRFEQITSQEGVIYWADFSGVRRQATMESWFKDVRSWIAEQKADQNFDATSE